MHTCLKVQKKRHCCTVNQFLYTKFTWVLDALVAFIEIFKFWPRTSPYVLCTLLKYFLVVVADLFSPETHFDENHISLHCLPQSTLNYRGILYRCVECLNFVAKSTPPLQSTFAR